MLQNRERYMNAVEAVLVKSVFGHGGLALVMHMFYVLGI